MKKDPTLAFPLVTKVAIRFTPSDKGGVLMELVRGMETATFTSNEVLKLRNYLTKHLRAYRQSTSRKH